MLAETGAGIDKDQLALLLAALRSDQLLAASLAGSLEGLRSVLVNALSSNRPLGSSLIRGKALGDPAADLVYTPVVPCRLVDTRGNDAPIQGGPFVPEERRTISPAGSCGLPSGRSRSLAACVSTRNLTLAGGGYMGMVAPGAPITSPTSVFTAGIDWAVGSSLVSTDAGGAFDVYVAVATSELIVDVMGYFRAPDGSVGTVTNIETGTGLMGGPITGAGTISVADGGVGTAQLAAGAVTQDKLATLAGAAPGKVLGTDGANLVWQSGGAAGGGVLDVTATAPLASSGGSTPNISLAASIPVASGGTGSRHCRSTGF